jgi:NADH-ubiquinone oxidoreductase chain 2
MLLIGILIIILVIGLIPEKVSNIFLNRIGTLMFLFSAVLSNNTYLFDPLLSPAARSSYGGLWEITTMNTGISTFIYLTAAAVLALGEGHSKGRRGFQSEYPLIIAISTLGSISLICSYDLISFFLAIELQSLSLYVIATTFKESESATSAGLKYFLLGGLSSGFILLGSSLLYGLTGMTNFEGLKTIGSFGSEFSSQQIELILLILAIGLLFKIAAAPFHNWAPDVYDGVPTLVTTWLAILPKISIVIFTTEFYANIFNQFHTWNSLFLFSAFFSLLIGSILGLNQSRIKRLLAYSSISHVGFILLALSVSGHQSIESLIFYLIQYSLTSLNVFYILIASSPSPSPSPPASLAPPPKVAGCSSGTPTELRYDSSSVYSPIQTLSQLRAQFKMHPLLALSFAISLFSMAGIPPCVGFFGKFFILLSAICDGRHFFMVLIAICTSVISAVYYIKVISILNADDPTHQHSKAVGERSKIILSNGGAGGHNKEAKETMLIRSNLVFNPPQPRSTLGPGPVGAVPAFIIAVLSLAIIFFIFNPTPMLNFVHLISLSIFV